MAVGYLDNPGNQIIALVIGLQDWFVCFMNNSQGTFEF